MSILSPLTGLQAEKQVPNTPYWIDPECGLWFQDGPHNHFPSKVHTTYPEAEGTACKGLVDALLKNWLGGSAKGRSIMDLGARETGMRDQWIDLGAGLSGASPGLFPSLAAEKDNRYDLLTLVHSFQRISASNIASSLLEMNVMLKPDGLVFIRMPDQEVPGHERDFTPGHFETARCFWSLDAFLEALWRTTSFKVAETYTIDGGARDYILKKILKRPTVCIGMIAKNEERDLPACLESLNGVADGICLIDTGSTDKTMDVANLWAANQGFHMQSCTGTQQKVHISQYFYASEKDATGDWKLWDFGKARNQYVKWIEEHKFDYVLWMDADDLIKNPRQIRNARFLDQYGIHAFGIESGGLEWHHHRMWKASLKIRYQGRCHEYPHFGSAQAMMHKGITIKHRNDPIPGMENSNPRNLRILEREFKEKPSARCAFYLANTFKDAGRHAEAIAPYAARLAYGKDYWDEYMFALLYKGRCERLAGKLDDARKTLLQGVQEHAGWAEFWMELHHLEKAANQPWKAMGYALQAKDAPIAPTTLFREPNSYTDQPYRQISWTWETLGYVEMAIKFAEEAKLKIGKPDADWDARIARLYAEQKKLNPPAAEARAISKGEVNQAQHVRAPKDAPCIIMHRPGALGDIIMTLNHVKALKEKHPGHRILYQCHESSARHLRKLILAAGCDDVIGVGEGVSSLVTMQVNLVGYPMREGYPEKPMKRHLLEYFGDELEVKTHWDSLVLDLPPRPHGLPEEYVTVHPQAGWSMYKNWPHERWEQVIAALKRINIPVLQIGGPKDQKLAGARFLGSECFDDALALQAYATVHMGVDSWTNHSTNIIWKGYVPERTSGVILWGSTQPSAAGYQHNTNLKAGLPCQPCFREDPKISAVSRGICPNPGGQTYEDPKHACMQAISVEDVVTAVIEKWLQNGGTTQNANRENL